MMTHALTIRQIAEKVKEVFLVAFLTLARRLFRVQAEVVFLRGRYRGDDCNKTQKTRLRCDNFSVDGTYGVNVLPDDA